MRSLAPTEKQLVERYVNYRLEKLKAVVISYNLWMSRKMEERFSLAAHYCTSIGINNTHIWMLSTTATGGVSLSTYVMGLVENFGLEAKIVGITSDGHDNIWVCRDALELKYRNASVFTTQSSLRHVMPCSYIVRGLQGGSAINQVG